MTDSPAPHVHVAIVGSGFGGLGAAIRLDQEGFGDFVILERAGDVGGVWRDNSYPGCACDVQSHLYSLSFAQNPAWSRWYSPQEEILQYLRGLVERFGLRARIRFGHDVREMRWDESAKRWHIETSQGAFTADFVVAGFGALSEASIPELPGLDRFEGATFHSARWDHTCDLRGRKVAVIGTGASAIQFVPKIQPLVGALRLFQRTPPWLVPRGDRAIGSGTKTLLHDVPGATWAVRGAIYAFNEAFVAGFLHPKVMRLQEKLVRRWLASQVPDPVLRAKVTPSYTIGCKRILRSDDYYPAITQPNVEVITEAIREVRPHGIVTADGVEHEVDTIVFGTGFKVTEMPFASHVRGRDGRTAAEVWNGSPKAFLGTTLTDFPNLFLLQGPNTGLGHTSVLIMMESQIEHMLEAMKHLRAHRLATVEPTPEAQARFVEACQERLAGTVWNAGGCQSWYLDRNGKNSTIWPGATFTYKRLMARFDPRDYAMQPAPSPVPSRATHPVNELERAHV